MAADFTMAIWVVGVEVATVGVGAADGMGFMGKDEVGVVGKGWVITITLYFLFTGALVLLFFSTFLNTRDFLVMELWWEGVLVHSCNWGWCWISGQACPATLGMSSSSVLRKDRDRTLCSRGNVK